MIDPKQILEKFQEDALRKIGVDPTTAEQYFQGMINHGDEIFESILLARKDFLTEDQVKKMREEYRTKKDKFSKIDLPTRYEDPVYYPKIIEHTETIEEVAKNLRVKDKNGQIKTLEDLGAKITRPLVGVAVSGDINAITIKAKGSDQCVIIIEAGLFAFGNLCSKAIARAFPFEGFKNDKFRFVYDDLDRIRNTIYNNKDITKKFMEATLNYLVRGDPRYAPPYIIEAPYSVVSGNLIRGMELFILGHEFSHVYFGHPGKSKLVSRPCGGEKLEEVLYSWQKEADADFYGLTFTLHAMESEMPQRELIYMCADMFFSCFECIERSIDIIKNGSDKFYWKGRKASGENSSHPPPFLRREKLRKEMMDSFGEVSIGPGIAVQYIVDTFFEEMIPILKKAPKEGALAPKWR